MRIKRWFRTLLYNAKMNTKLGISFLLVAMIPISLLGTTAYVLTIKNLEKTEFQNMDSRIGQVTNAMDYLVELYINKAMMLWSSASFNKTLNGEYATLLEKKEAAENIEDMLGQISADIRNKNLHNSYYVGGNLQVCLFVKNESLYWNYKTVAPLSEIEGESLYQQMLEEDAMYVWHMSEKGDYAALDYRIINFDTGEDCALLRIQVPRQRLYDVLEKNRGDEEAEIYCFDPSGNLTISTVSALDEGELKRLAELEAGDTMYQFRVNGEKCFIRKSLAPITGWTIVYTLPGRLVIASLQKMITVIILIFVGSIFLSIYAANKIAPVLTRRLDTLLHKTEQVKEGNFAVTEVIEGEDEIGRLDRHFNAMAQQIGNLIEKEYTQRLIASQTRLELLQEQINPHLLYNTLAMVKNAAGEAGQEMIVDVTGTLISFYKGILNKGKIYTTVREEVALVKRYVELCRYVYKLDIELICEIEEEILDCCTVKLLLQPLVENSVLHGLRPKGGGILELDGRAEGEKIVFSIFDDGVGMDEETLQQLNMKNASNYSGYGIGNIRRRLELLYKGEADLKFESEKEAGTVSTLTVAKMTEDEIMNKMMQEKEYDL